MLTSGDPLPDLSRSQLIDKNVRSTKMLLVSAQTDSISKQSVLVHKDSRSAHPLSKAGLAQINTFKQLYHSTYFTDRTDDFYR